MSQSDFNVHEQIKQCINEMVQLKRSFDNTHDFNEKKRCVDAIRELHGKIKCLLLKHEIDNINDYKNKDYKMISRNHTLICYMESCIRKCEKKLYQETKQENHSDEMFMPQENCKEYRLRPKNGMYELSLNIDPTESAKYHDKYPAAKKTGNYYDSPSSAKYMNELHSNYSGTSDNELSMFGFVSKRKPAQWGGAGEDETLSTHVNGVQTTEGNNLVDEYLNSLKKLVGMRDPTLTEQINNLETSEANGLVEEYDEKLKGLKTSTYDVKKPTLVRYHASWCHISTQSAPAWKEFEKRSSIPDLQIVDLNVGNDPIKQNLAKRVGVTGFPSIRLFKDGVVYECHERSADGIELFCEQHLKK